MMLLQPRNCVPVMQQDSRIIIVIVIVALRIY